MAVMSEFVTVFTGRMTLVALAVLFAACTQASGATAGATPTAVWAFTVVPVGTPVPSPMPSPEPAASEPQEQIPLGPGFELAGSLSMGRWGLSATVLEDGTVLVVGGQERRSFSRRSPSEAELLAPGATEWLKTEQVTYERSFHTATLLTDGRLLVAGGSGREVLAEEEDRVFRGRKDLATVEVYDPDSGKWSEAAEMLTARSSGRALLLEDGRVLVIGGSSGVKVIDKVELYDPATDEWTEAEPMSTVRSFHTATVLVDGRILVVGGQTRNMAQASTEIYDPATGEWTVAADLARPRSAHSAVLLGDGRVLVVGGSDLGASNVLGPETTAEIYDPVADTWTLVATDLKPRISHESALLPDGRVAVVGGENVVGLAVSDVEVYDPATGAWKIVGALPDGRSLLAVAVLPDGALLIAGGGVASGFTGFPTYVLRFNPPD